MTPTASLTARAVIKNAMADHLYTCNQSSDPCYESVPHDGETWADLAQRRAEHIARFIDAAIVLPS